MRLHAWLVIAVALITSLGAASPAMGRGGGGDDGIAGQPEGVRALEGEWVYAEDRTEGREAEQQQPSMSAKVTLRVEENAVVWVRSDGEVRVALDGSATEVTREGSTSRFKGGWKDGVLAFESEPVRAEGDTRPKVLIRWELRPTPEGLVAGVTAGPNWSSVALYRHPQDIALPEPAKATIADMAWLAGAWVGTRGSGGATSIEERWSPPLGGAMLATSRTVSRDRMRAFEFLRIVERDGGLVYVAQPNGRAPTEFVLTEVGEKRAVFENPRHDFPQRIVYEQTAEGLTASIGFAKGGKPQRFEFKGEGR